MSWREHRLIDEDIILRPWEDGDQESLGTSQRDPEIGRYFGRAIDYVEGETLPDDPDAPVFAIVEDGAVLGVIWFRRGARPFEVGYYLRQDCCGRGARDEESLARVRVDARGDGSKRDCALYASGERALASGRGTRGLRA